MTKPKFAVGKENIMYQIKRYEWDLIEEEKEQAKFIWEDAIRGIILKSRTGIGHSDQEREAFAFFRLRFYSRVWARLGLYVEHWYGHEDETFAEGAFTLNESGTKLIGYRVEEVPDKGAGQFKVSISGSTG